VDSRFRGNDGVRYASEGSLIARLLTPGARGRVPIACRPFFAGLLPEDRQRDAIASALGISKQDDFGLLAQIGGDVAGALSLVLEGETPRIDSNLETKPLDEDGLLQVLDDLPKRPLLAGREGLRLSLAGAQSKLPVVLVEGKVALPAPGQATTHILKPPIARFQGTTENEAFVMTLAATIGLMVAPVEGRKVAGRPYLLITRFDRRFDENGQAQRLHQEDFCQALGIPPERKYASEGGPTLKTSFELLRNAVTQPAGAVLGLLDAVIFNIIVGNADAHGKNFSLLYRNDTTSLAPLYDLLSTVAYPELSSNFAMKIGKRARLDEIGPLTWTDFAKEAGLSAPFVRRRVEELADAVMTNAPAVVTHSAVVRARRRIPEDVRLVDRQARGAHHANHQVMPRSASLARAVSSVTRRSTSCSRMLADPLSVRRDYLNPSERSQKGLVTATLPSWANSIRDPFPYHASIRRVTSTGERFLRSVHGSGGGVLRASPAKLELLPGGTKPRLAKRLRVSPACAPAA